MKCQECGADRPEGDKHCRTCGTIFERPISEADKRRLFAIIKKAHDNWPESEPHFDSVQVFRGWLTVRAGFTHVHLEAYPEDRSDEWRSGFRHGWLRCSTEYNRHSERYSESRLTEAGIETHRPRSWSRDAGMGQGEFGALRDAITEIIELTIGCTVDELLNTRVA